MQYARLSLLSTVFLVACGTAQSPAPSPVIHEEAQTGAIAPKMQHAVYTIYSDRVLTKGDRAVLFFAQTTDPFSQSSDTILQSLYGSGAATISTYRIDFDKERGARLEYGVLLPDTFVILGSSGNKNLLHPSQDDLKTLLLSSTRL